MRCCAAQLLRHVEHLVCFIYSGRVSALTQVAPHASEFDVRKLLLPMSSDIEKDRHVVVGLEQSRRKVSAVLASICNGPLSTLTRWLSLRHSNACSAPLAAWRPQRAVAGPDIRCLAAIRRVGRAKGGDASLPAGELSSCLGSEESHA
jgi:hypothetical protein